MLSSVNMPQLRTTERLHCGTIASRNRVSDANLHRYDLPSHLRNIAHSTFVAFLVPDTNRSQCNSRVVATSHQRSLLELCYTYISNSFSKSQLLTANLLKPWVPNLYFNNQISGFYQRHDVANMNCCACKTTKRKSNETCEHDAATISAQFYVLKLYKHIPCLSPIQHSLWLLMRQNLIFLPL